MPKLTCSELAPKSAVNIGPKRFHHKRTVSGQMLIPRSNNKSSTFRKLSRPSSNSLAFTNNGHESDTASEKLNG